MLVGVFDAHVHIIDSRFPVVPNNGFVPDQFTVADYKAQTAGLPIDGGTVVSGSFQETDSAFLVAALAEFGEGWVGVVQLDPGATDADIIALDQAGVRALRFNLKRGAIDLAELTHQALRAYDLVGWHAEMYVDGSLLPSLEPVIAKLPAVSIDHLGMSEEGLDYLLGLVARGARVKATGFGRVELDVPAALRRIHAVDPCALMWGSDLPGTRARRPFEESDLRIIADAVGDDLAPVFDANARAFYRLPPKPDPALPNIKPPTSGAFETKKYSIADLKEYMGEE